ncbi:MAG: S49 family peptidase [Pseudomonadota bacterium]
MIDRLTFWKSNPPTVSVVRLSGAIAGGGRFGGAVLNDQSTAGLIERAFKRGKPAAVALAINSPGGSPTQSALIAARIRRLADETDTPVYAFCEDVAASGGYWLATAADHIYADDNSILGSIGVISAGFGFPEFIAKYGIERRVYTAGENKSTLDPFKPENPEDIERLKELQLHIHENFKTQVRSRRGERLKEDTPELFSGRIWVGQQAVDVGLADGLGHLVPKMKEIFGDKTRFAVSAQKRSLFQRVGAPGAEELMDAIETRAQYARFGL